MNERKEIARVEAWKDISQEVFTKVEFENITEDSVAAELLLTVVQAVSLELLSGGMKMQDCYNLILYAVRGASEQFKNKELENNE